MSHSQLQTRLQQAEEETQRLRKLNEKLMFNTAEQRQALHRQQQQAGAAY
jgi:multidrug resistance efflux pump